MERLLEILNEINPDVDYTAEDNLIDGKILDSFSIISLITAISDEFDIEIGPQWLKNENFNSASAMWAMIGRIRDEA